MATTEPNGAHGARNRRATISEIEQEAALVLLQEQAAVDVLVYVLRELAVDLPRASRLPIELARAAKTLELFGGLRDPQLRDGIRTALCEFSQLIRALSDDRAALDDEEA